MDYYSIGDFQCDETEGYPTLLCYYQTDSVGYAWLIPASCCLDEWIEDAKEVCAKWGVRHIWNKHDINKLLIELLGEHEAQFYMLPEEESEED